MYYPHILADFGVRSRLAFAPPYIVLHGSTGFCLLTASAKFWPWSAPPLPPLGQTRASNLSRRTALTPDMADGVPVPRLRGPGKQPKCRGDSEKCHRCVKRIGCCLKKPTPCGKRDCVVCSSKQQADGAATTPTVGKRSSRTRKKAPGFAAAGSRGEFLLGFYDFVFDWGNYFNYEIWRRHGIEYRRK